METNHFILENEQCSLQIEDVGGSIVDFHLKGQNINPLNFKMLHQSPFHEDLYFKGHFLCAGRWGDPSKGEMAKGVNKHGEFVKLKWAGKQEANTLDMFASSKLEGLSVTRRIEISSLSACYKITDNLCNENPLGRMYQIMQHPSLAGPFLNSDTIVDCNATAGFDYAHEKFGNSIVTQWPNVYTKNGLKLKLDRPDKNYSSVFPFIVNPAETFGWITAWSPEHRLLIGYIWEREDYPWINHWLHWEEPTSGLSPEGNETENTGKILYRGLEFGNTGIHKCFNEIFSQNLLHILGETSVGYIDAGETHTRTFYSFLHTMPEKFKGVQQVNFNKRNITILEKKTNEIIVIPHNFNQEYEF